MNNTTVYYSAQSDSLERKIDADFTLELEELSKYRQRMSIMDGEDKIRPNHILR